MQILKIVLMCFDALMCVLMIAAPGHVKTNGSAILSGVLAITMAINALVIYFG